MPERKVEQVAEFKRDLRRLARRCPDLPGAVAAVLKTIFRRRATGALSGTRRQDLVLSNNK